MPANHYGATTGHQPSSCGTVKGGQPHGRPRLEVSSKPSENEGERVSETSQSIPEPLPDAREWMMTITGPWTRGGIDTNFPRTKDDVKEDVPIPGARWSMLPSAIVGRHASDLAAPAWLPLPCPADHKVDRSKNSSSHSVVNDGTFSQ
ncbi:hypothetical protein J6590_028491 [Homalodisca vitripennis]|nr:hypothetical protein J6590_028491 [Homalodisca vitripennis]